MLEGFDLAGRAAVVTGGGTGIGKAIAELLAQRGADVAVAGRRADVLENAAQQIRSKTGRKSLAVPADVRRHEDAFALMEKVANELGRIDILVNNAGGAHDHIGLSKMDLAKWDRDIALNLSSAQYCSQAALPFLKAHRNGAIVHISSLAGVEGTPGVGAYSAAKAGLRMLTRVMSSEWGPAGVRINCVAPGLVATEGVKSRWEEQGVDPMQWCQAFPLRRYAEESEIAQAVVFLASDAASYITGETLTVGGGPRLGGMIEVED